MIGFVVCKAVVHAHGGEIGVRPRDNDEPGSLFFFELPVYAKTVESMEQIDEQTDEQMNE